MPTPAPVRSRIAFSAPTSSLSELKRSSPVRWRLCASSPDGSLVSGPGDGLSPLVVDARDVANVRLGAGQADPVEIDAQRVDLRGEIFSWLRRVA